MIELRHEVKALRSAAAGADTDLSKQVYETQVLKIELETLRKSLPDITKSKLIHLKDFTRRGSFAAQLVCPPVTGQGLVDERLLGQ